MGILVLVALAGFAASLVDGALGMGFGPTSSTILLGAGLTPAAVSTTVNIAKVASGAAGGLAHWRFGNIDWRLVLRLAAPGCVGAIVGATVLATVDGDQLRPYLAVLLLVVGLRILVRFSKPRAASTEAAATTDVANASTGSSVAGATTASDGTDAAAATDLSTNRPTNGGRPGDQAAVGLPDDEDRPALHAGDSASADGEPGTSVGSYDHRYIGAAALAGGVTNGLIGAWGPVVTPVLLSRRGLEPRVAIGSVNTAEIAVALVASGSLITSLGGAGVDAGKLAAMLLGGVLAAPLAAWVVRHLEPRLLGIGAGGLMLVTNTRELAGWADLGPVRWLAYGTVALACIVAARRSRPEPVATEPTKPDAAGAVVTEAVRRA